MKGKGKVELEAPDGKACWPHQAELRKTGQKRLRAILLKERMMGEVESRFYFRQGSDTARSV